MISGWFGIKATSKGLLSLFFSLYFYSVLLLAAYILVTKSFDTSILKDSVLSCLGINYWFIPAYVILYVLSPALNLFVESANRNTFLWVLIAFFAFQLLYGRFGDHGHFESGYSAISFIGLYLISGYVRRYRTRIFTLPPYIDFCIFVALTLCSTAIGFLGGYETLGGSHSIMDYNHPLVIVSSAYFFIPFTKMNIKSRTINWLASSAFAIYIIHMHFLVKEPFRETFRVLYQSHQGILFISISAVLILLIALSCILIDKVRIAAWNITQQLFNKTHLHA